VAIVRAPGDVTIESDIARSSFVAKGIGQREVDLGNGKAAEFGFHRVTVISGQARESLLIPVLSREAAVPLPEPALLADADELAIGKFYSALKSNGRAYLASWPARKALGENIVKIATAGTLMVLCVAEPSKISCIAAGAATGDVVFEGCFEFLNHAVGEMEMENRLSDSEAQTMRLILKGLKGAKIVLSVAMGNGVAERVVDGLEVVTLALDDSSPVRFVFGLQRDTAGKAVKLIEVVKKLNP